VASLGFVGADWSEEELSVTFLMADPLAILPEKVGWKESDPTLKTIGALPSFGLIITLAAYLFLGATLIMMLLIASAVRTGPDAVVGLACFGLTIGGWFSSTCL
jgi:hypothetical protein